MESLEISMFGCFPVKSIMGNVLWQRGWTWWLPEICINDRLWLCDSVKSTFDCIKKQDYHIILSTALTWCVCWTLDWSVLLFPFLKSVSDCTSKIFILSESTVNPLWVLLEKGLWIELAEISEKLKMNWLRSVSLWKCPCKQQQMIIFCYK